MQWYLDISEFSETLRLWQHDDKGSKVHSHISHSTFPKELREDQKCIFVGPLYTIDATHKDTKTL